MAPIMEIWAMAKYAVNSALDHIERKPPKPVYKLHPDSAYLGTKYYPTEAPGTAVKHSAGRQAMIAASASRSTISSDYAAHSFPGSSARSQMSNTQENGGKPGGASASRPHVHIGTRSVQLPPLLPESKYAVLLHDDLADDKKIHRAVKWNQDVYLAIKDVVVLMQAAKEQSSSMTSPMLETQMPVSHDRSSNANEPIQSVASSNPLRSRSVEEFFADVSEPERYCRIDRLPPNPMVKGAFASGLPNPQNRLSLIPISESVVVLRHSTQELFVRKQDGKLYPVVWKVQSRSSEDCDDLDANRGMNFTNIRGEIDGEDYVDVGLM